MGGIENVDIFYMSFDVKAQQLFNLLYLNNN
jgi:hypothetical protein